MDILFTAPEGAWAGFLGKIRKELPEHRFDHTGFFGAETLAGYDVIIPTMTQIPRELIETADRLRLIQQSGVGVENIDIDAATEGGIFVANVPGDVSGNADSVAELGVFLMVGLARNFMEWPVSFQDGTMGRPQGNSLVGATVGLVGLGAIGSSLARRLAPFGVELIGIKRAGQKKAKKELGLSWVGGPDDLPELLGRSDYVVLCLPATDETRRMINENTLAMMKPTAFLINLSRGGLVDRDALEEALEEGVIAGAGLDVYWTEPPDFDDPIFALNVLATPHIAGSTDATMRGIVSGVAENIRRLDRGERPLYLKNPDLP